MARRSHNTARKQKFSPKPSRPRKPKASASAIEPGAGCRAIEMLAQELLDSIWLLSTVAPYEPDPQLAKRVLGHMRGHVEAISVFAGEVAKARGVATLPGS